ncbi:MAG: DUF3800 domain-containing protein [Armatimonadota bacterium]
MNNSTFSEKEYIIFCDESDKKGKYFSNFYGGVLVGASQYQRITKSMNEKKNELNLFGEVKWSKVSERYLPKYQDLIKCFFEEVAVNNLKVRIMFSQNAWQPTGLTREDIELQYFKLYYQFIKHGFGLRYIDGKAGATKLRLYPDQLPDTHEKIEMFKGYLLALQYSKEFRNSGITIAKEDIAEVRSHDHVLLQCLDIVLGSMSFRLNDKHRDKPEGSQFLAKKTKAKHTLYKTIHDEIRKIYPNFNIGISTGKGRDYANRWNHPYRHWLFRPGEGEYDESLTKGKSK